MRKKVVKGLAIGVAVFVAGVALGVAAGVYVAWLLCLNLLAILLLLPVGVAGW